jgi:dolichol-phosphate mannosyltransferase
MISVVFPVFNEKKNIRPLVEELTKTLEGIGEDFELIAVDDGSRDGSFEELKEVAKENGKLKVIGFMRNFGQTSALLAGITATKGDSIVTIDSDLENNPSDIPLLLKTLEEAGVDVVSGWRKGRWQKQRFSRKLPSFMANWLISTMSGLKLHDFGCTLKVYRRRAIVGVPLYGEMHRFIPAYLHWNGATVAEVPVHYRERIHGKSKYGFSRTFRVVLDLLLIKFLTRYMNRPIHFFGGIGLVSLFVGFIAGLVAVILKITGLRTFVSTPLPVFAALFTIVGVQFIVMGVLAEVLMRIYYESQKKQPYEINEKINF